MNAPARVFAALVGLALLPVAVPTAHAEELAIERIESLRVADWEGVDPTKSYLLFQTVYASPAFLEITTGHSGSSGRSRIIVPNVRRTIARQGQLRTILAEVSPGDYALYGAVFPVQGGAWGGLCACLGTVSFRAEAGKVVSIGEIGGILNDMLAGVPGGWPEMALKSDRPTSAISIRPAIDLPPFLPRDIVTDAQFNPVNRLENPFGLLVERLDEIPGLFHYDWDRMIVENGSPD